MRFRFKTIDQIRWEDLAKIESPFFAQTLFARISPDRSIEKKLMLNLYSRLFRTTTGLGELDNHLLQQRLIGELKRGRLVCLKDSPMQPLFTWKKDPALPRGGSWVSKSSDVLATSHLRARIKSIARQGSNTKSTAKSKPVPILSHAGVEPKTVSKKEEPVYKLVEVMLSDAQGKGSGASARKQYINLSANAQEYSHSRTVVATARLDQEVANIGVNFSIEAAADNRSNLPNSLQASIKASVRTNAKGLAETKLEVSRFGGDKFVITASLDGKNASSGSVARKSAEVTVWRKMFYQITADKTAKLPVRDKTFSAFESSFVEIEEVNENLMDYGSIQGLTRHPLWQFRSDLRTSADGDRQIVCVGDHNKQKFYQQFKAKNQPVTGHLIMCDAQWDPILGPANIHQLTQRHSELFQKNAAGNSYLGVFDPPLNGGALVSAGVWVWHDGKVQHNGDIGNHHITINKTRRHPTLFELTLPDKCVAGECKGCKGGTAIAPSTALPAKAKIQLQCGTGPWAGESGQPGKPQCLIVVNSDEDQFNNTIAHEIGHLFKQVRQDKNWLGIPDHPDQYVKRGGQGSHCKKDATESATAKDQDGNTVYENGTCIMYHVAVGNTTFCENCSLDLKVRDMSDFFK